MSFEMHNFNLDIIEAHLIGDVLRLLPDNIQDYNGYVLDEEIISHNLKQYGETLYALTNENNKAVGITGLLYNEEINGFEVLLELTNGYYNKGLFFPLLDKFIDDAFNKLNVDKIFMKAPENSIKDNLILSYGLKCEGEISLGNSNIIYKYYELYNDNLADKGMEYLYPSVLQEWDNIF